MATLFIEEYDDLGRDSQDNIIGAPKGRAVTTQVETITSSSTQSNSFNKKTKYVIVTADVECHIAFGVSPTATGTTIYMPAFVPRPFAVTPEDKVAVIEKQ